MSKEEVKKMLGEQLALLAQRARSNDTSCGDLCRLTDAMLEILDSDAWRFTDQI